MRISKSLFGPGFLGIALLWTLAIPIAAQAVFAQAEITAGCG